MVEAAAPRLEAWAAVADLVAQQVAAGERVVFLCEGDVSLFASASYLLLALRRRHPACPGRLSPGITAVAAAAAAAAWPLALQQEQLLISPTPDTPEELALLLAAAAATGQQLALLKLGQRWRWVRPLLADRGLLASSLVGERVGWPEQRLLPAAELAASELPYFSLLLVRQGWPAVLP
jgi:precorrin-2/cobalt-factor-2 C20-methyltransferase